MLAPVVPGGHSGGRQHHAFVKQVAGQYCFHIVVDAARGIDQFQCGGIGGDGRAGLFGTGAGGDIRAHL